MTTTMPPGIITQPTRLPNGMIYEFSHRRLGNLGKLILTEVPGRGMQISAEAERGNLSDPQYLQRLETLNQVVQTVLDALPGENPPMPGLDEIKRKVTLYQRFIHTNDAQDMEQFARSLSQQEQALLFELIKDNISTTMQTQDLGSTYGIVQREHDLRRLLEARSSE